MSDFVTQKECEQRRANIQKDYDELAERVCHGELDNVKLNERIKTLFSIVKFLSGIASAVLVAEIINLIGKVV